MLIEVECDQEGGCAVDVFLNAAGWCAPGESDTGPVRLVLTE